MPEGTELTLPNMTTTTTTTTLLMPGQTTTTTFNSLHPHANGCASLIFPNQSMNHTVRYSHPHTSETEFRSSKSLQTTIPVNNPSLLQQQQYSYPSLLNGNVSATNNMLAAPTLNIFSNNTNHMPSTNSYPYSSQPATILPPSSLLPPAPISTSGGLSRSFHPPITHSVDNQATIPLKNLQISSTSSPITSSPRPSAASAATTVPSAVQLNPSPMKSLNQSSNSDIVVHYIGGFVIRESSQPFPTDEHQHEDDDHVKDLNASNNGKEKENTSFDDNHSDLGSDQLRCVFCKKVDLDRKSVV